MSHDAWASTYLPIGVPDDATREAVDAPVLGARRTPTAPNEAPNAATDQFGTDGPDINEVAAFSPRREPPRVWWRLGLVDSGRVGRLLLSVVAVSNSTGGMSPIGVEAPVVFHQCTQLRVASSTWSTVRHGPRWGSLALVEAVDDLGDRVVVGVTARADGGDGAFGGEPFGVADRQVLHAPLGVVDEAVEVLALRVQIAISNASSARSARRVVATRQPTIRRENTSVTNAAYANPDHVAT